MSELAKLHFVDQMKGLQLAEWKTRLSQLQAIYHEVARQTDNPEVVAYPAGSAELLPFLMKSVQAQVTWDVSPFFSPNETLFPYSKVMNTILTEQQGQFIPLENIYQDQRMGESLQKSLIDQIYSANNSILSNIKHGYKDSSDPRVFETNQDILTESLGQMLALGVDLQSVHLRMDSPTEYTLKFSLGGEEKEFIYNQTHIDNGFSRRGSATYESLQQPFKKLSKGNILLFVKADIATIAKYIIDAVQPTNIVTDTSTSSTMIIWEQTQRYTFQRIQNVPFTHFRWGYGPANKITIGKKRSV